MMQYAFFALLASILAADVASQCHNYLDDYTWYTITSCPLTSTTRLPITFTNATVNAIPTSNDFGPGDYDNGYIVAQPPFQVQMYGLRYSSVFIGVNGVLSFGQLATSNVNDAFPMYDFESSPTYSVLPLIAALWSDHYWNTTTGSISYSTEGVSGSRLFIVRYDHLLFASTRSYSNASVSFDVLFDESKPGSIEVRYFQYDNLPSAGVGSNIPTTVGLMSNAKPFIAILNSENDWTTIEDILVGRSIVYTPTPTGTGQTYDCGSLGYNFTQLMGRDLTWTDDDGNTIVYRPCGTVVNPSCYNAQGPSSTDMICYIPSNTSIPVSNVANFWNVDPIYQFPLDINVGVQAVYIDHVPCDDNWTPRTTVINFICETFRSHEVARITGFERPSACISTLEIETYLACGPGSRTNDTQNPNNPESTLAACVVIQGVLYNAHLCPRDSSSLGYLPPNMTMPQTLPTHPYYASDLIRIGFPFYFYGQEWDALYVTMNGGIFFNGQVATPLLAGPEMAGVDNNEVDFYPLIAPLSMPLSTLNLLGQTGAVSYSYEGTAPNRQFIIRFDVQFLGWEAILYMGASFDVVLSEKPSGVASGIEVRYYSISSNPNLDVQIGVHGDESLNSYTSFNNYLPLSPALASRLQGATLSFEYTGVTPVNGCIAFGHDFSSVNVSYADGDTSYYINMCGSVTYPPLCTSSFPKSSACQVTNGQSSAHNLAIYNPSAIRWSVSPSPLVGVRAQLADGEFCGDAQRIVIVDYICNLNDTSRTDHVASFIESPMCTYNFQIHTARACKAQPVNPTDAGSSSSSLSGGAIAGIVIGSVVGGCLVLAILMYCCLGSCCKKSDKYKKSEGTGEEASRNEHSELSVVNADPTQNVELQHV